MKIRTAKTVRFRRVKKKQGKGGKRQQMIKILNNPLDILFETIRKVNDITAELVFLSKEQCDGNWGFTQKDSDGNFLIGIAVELSWQDALEIIAHEAAHIMDKSHDKPETE